MFIHRPRQHDRPCIRQCFRTRMIDRQADAERPHSCSGCVNRGYFTMAACRQRQDVARDNHTAGVDYRQRVSDLGAGADVSFGQYAPLAMLALCAVAYLFGSAIRFDIGAAEGRPRPPPLVAAAETQSGAVLAFAYFISDRSTCFRPQWFPLEILFVHYQSVALAQRIWGYRGEIYVQHDYQKTAKNAMFFAEL